MQKLYKNEKYKFIYSNCILHPYGSSNYNTKACKHIKEKQHKHNKYVNVQLSYLIRDIWAGGKGHIPPPFGKILKSWIFSIEACIQITFFLISFHFVLFFAYQFWKQTTFSGPPSKLVPHFLVHSYSSANSMHV